MVKAAICDPSRNGRDREVVSVVLNADDLDVAEVLYFTVAVQEIEELRRDLSDLFGTQRGTVAGFTPDRRSLRIIVSECFALVGGGAVMMRWRRRVKGEVCDVSVAAFDHAFVCRQQQSGRGGEGATQTGREDCLQQRKSDAVPKCIFRSSIQR